MVRHYCWLTWKYDFRNRSWTGNHLNDQNIHFKEDISHFTTKASNGTIPGMPRSEKRKANWCVVSGRRLAKSQKAFASFKCVLGLRFCVWMKDGKRFGSRIKKIGVLLPTKSHTPSSVYSLTGENSCLYWCKFFYTHHQLLTCKTPRVSHRICTSRFTCHSRESNGNRCAFANMLKDLAEKGTYKMKWTFGETLTWLTLALEYLIMSFLVISR